MIGPHLGHVVAVRPVRLPGRPLRHPAASHLPQDVALQELGVTVKVILDLQLDQRNLVTINLHCKIVLFPPHLIVQRGFLQFCWFEPLVREAAAP